MDIENDLDSLSNAYGILSSNHCSGIGDIYYIFLVFKFLVLLQHCFISSYEIKSLLCGMREYARTVNIATVPAIDAFT